MNLASSRAFGFWSIQYTVTVVSLLAAAGTPALPLKPLDLRPPDLHRVLLSDSAQTIRPIDPEDTPAFVIVGAAQLLEMQSHTHVPQAGIGSLYWALQHPTRAWRIFLPRQ